MGKNGSRPTDCWESAIDVGPLCLFNSDPYTCTCVYAHTFMCLHKLSITSALIYNCDLIYRMIFIHITVHCVLPIL